MTLFGYIIMWSRAQVHNGWGGLDFPSLRISRSKAAACRARATFSWATSAGDRDLERAGCMMRMKWRSTRQLRTCYDLSLKLALAMHNVIEPTIWVNSITDSVIYINSQFLNQEGANALGPTCRCTIIINMLQRYKIEVAMRGSTVFYMLSRYTIDMQLATHREHVPKS